MKKRKMYILLSVVVLILLTFGYKKFSNKNIQDVSIETKQDKEEKKKEEKKKEESKKLVDKNKNQSIYAEKDIEFKDLIATQKPIILDIGQST